MATAPTIDAPGPVLWRRVMEREHRADGRPDEVQRHLSAVPWTGKNLRPCAVCHGEGSVERTDPLEIRIKAGHARRAADSDSGQRQCRAARGRVGDLYVIIRIGEHALFSREAMISESRCGDGGGRLWVEIEVPNDRWAELLKIPPGTQSGQKLGCGEKGVRRPPRTGRWMRSSSGRSPCDASRRED